VDTGGDGEAKIYADYALTTTTGQTGGRTDNTHNAAYSTVTL